MNYAASQKSATGSHDKSNSTHPAFPDDFPCLRPCCRVALGVDTILSQTGIQGILGRPCVVMGDLGRSVVHNVGLADSVHGAAEDVAAESAEEAGTTHERAIECGEGTAGEGECRGLVVGESGVGVLEESDHDEPVVNLSLKS